MSVSFSRVTILGAIITAITLVILPVNSHAKDENNSNAPQKRGLEPLSQHIRQEVRQLHDRVERLESRIMAPAHRHNANVPHEAPADSRSESAAAPQPVQAAPVKETKLTGDKHATCTKNLQRVTAVLHEVRTKRQQSFDQITRIADAAQQFYNAHHPTIDNYDAVLATVASARTTAANALAQFNHTPHFSCDSTTPQSDFMTLKAHRDTSVEALKVYRDAVSTLITTLKQTQTAPSGQGR